MTKETLEERIRRHIKDADQMEYNQIDEWVPVFDTSGLVENFIAEVDEWAKIQSIAFAEWVDKNNFKSIIHSGDKTMWQAGREAQVFSTESVYNLFLENQKK